MLAIGFTGIASLLQTSTAIAACIDTTPAGGTNTLTSVETCSTALTSGQLYNDTAPFTLNTTAGFSINAPASNALTVDTPNGGTGDVDIDVSAGSVTGDFRGLQIQNQGVGNTIVETADVIGVAADAVRVFNQTDANDLTVVTNGRLSSGDTALEARNFGQGDTTVTTHGHMTSTNWNLFVLNGADAGKMEVETNGGIYSDNFHGITLVQQSQRAAADSAVILRANEAISAGGDGIRVANDGSGDVDIDTSAAIEGRTGHGIFTETVATSGAVDITTLGTVTGAQDGITVNHLGTGDLLVDTDAAVTGGTHGIDINHAAAGNLTVDAKDTITGVGHGIRTTNSGLGDTTITTENVNGTDSQALDIVNGATAGAIDITTNGVVHTDTFTGIHVTQDSTTGGDATVAANDTVTGGSNGNFVDLNGNGSVDIETQNTVTGNGSNGIGVDTVAGSGAVDIRSIGEVVGATRGIFVDHKGTGDLTVDAADTVTGGEGILTSNTGTGNTTISAVDVVGTAGDGIEATNGATSGSMDIVVTGMVSATDDGIDANHSGTGDVIIDTALGMVMGADHGIDVDNNGTADAIVSTGQVMGVARNGVDVVNQATAGTIIINTDDTVSGNIGINAFNHGTGDLFVATEAVTGTGGDAIAVENDPTAGDIDVTTNGVINGARHGIYAWQRGTNTSELNIETHDMVVVPEWVLLHATSAMATRTLSPMRWWSARRTKAFSTMVRQRTRQSQPTSL